MRQALTGNLISKGPALLIAGALLLTACAPGAAVARNPSGGESSGTNRGSGAPAPDFELAVYQGQETLGGEEVRLSELLSRGQPVVLNFWAGLCPPCRVEMPDLQSAYDQHQDQILLVGLDVGPFTNLGTREEGQALLRDLGVDYPAGTTFDDGIVERYSVLGMPSTYFITPEGQIVETWAGLLTEEKLNELIEELLAASSPNG